MSNMKTVILNTGSVWFTLEFTAVNHVGHVNKTQSTDAVYNVKMRR